MITVIKRNGDSVEFDKDKIRYAIARAYEGETVPRYVNIIANKVERIAKK